MAVLDALPDEMPEDKGMVPIDSPEPTVAISQAPTGKVLVQPKTTGTTLDELPADDPTQTEKVGMEDGNVLNVPHGLSGTEINMLHGIQNKGQAPDDYIGMQNVNGALTRLSTWLSSTNPDTAKQATGPIAPAKSIAEDISQILTSSNPNLSTTNSEVEKSLEVGAKGITYALAGLDRELGNIGGGEAIAKQTAQDMAAIQKTYNSSYQVSPFARKVIEQGPLIAGTVATLPFTGPVAAAGLMGGISNGSAYNDYLAKNPNDKAGAAAYAIGQGALAAGATYLGGKLGLAAASKSPAFTRYLGEGLVLGGTGAIQGAGGTVLSNAAGLSDESIIGAAKENAMLFLVTGLPVSVLHGNLTKAGVPEDVATKLSNHLEQTKTEGEAALSAGLKEIADNQNHPVNQAAQDGTRAQALEIYKGWKEGTLNPETYTQMRNQGFSHEEAMKAATVGSDISSPDDNKPLNQLPEAPRDPDLDKPLYQLPEDPAPEKRADIYSQIFRPDKVSESAKAVAGILREQKGLSARNSQQTINDLNKDNKTINALPNEDRLNLIDYIEGGSELSKPELKPIADKIKDIYQSFETRIREVFPDAALRKDYFTHQYEDQPAADKFFSDFIAKQGSGKNLNQRAFPTLKEAIDAGLKPKTTNPLETVVNYVSNMNNFLASQQAVHDMISQNIAGYYENGKQPAGWVPLEGNFGAKPDRAVIPPNSNSGDPIIIKGKGLYAPENAARVYNNDISQSFSGPVGDITDTFQKGANFVNKLILGLSTYHASTVTMSSIASDVGRAIFNRDLGALGQAATPGANTRLGGKVEEQYLGEKDYGPRFQKVVDLMTTANSVNTRQQTYWKAGPAKDFFDSFKAGSLGEEAKQAVQNIKDKPVSGSLGTIASGIGRTMDTISKPLFDYYVPRLKLAANFSELHAWLDQHPTASIEEQKQAARDIGDSIDNRFGEMQRDNLFWHAMTRQTMQMTFLSYSWVTGAARMLKGIPDTGKAIITRSELSPNAKYLFGMAATYAVVNGIATYLKTGETPDNWKDFVYYRTGGTTPQGKEERSIIPGHTMQFTNYLHDGIGELGNEMNPALKMLYYVTNNEDFRGFPITNSNNKWYDSQRWEDYSKFILKQNQPILLKTLLEGNKKGSNLSTGEKMLGVRTAPMTITDPEGYEAMIKRKNDQASAAKVRSDEKLSSQIEGNPDLPKKRRERR